MKIKKFNKWVAIVLSMALVTASLSACIIRVPVETNTSTKDEDTEEVLEKENEDTEINDASESGSKKSSTSKSDDKTKTETKKTTKKATTKISAVNNNKKTTSQTLNSSNTSSSSKTETSKSEKNTSQDQKKEEKTDKKKEENTSSNNAGKTAQTSQQTTQQSSQKTEPVKTTEQKQDNKPASSATCSHSWGPWLVDTAPSCTSTGTQHRTCKLCAKTEQGTLPKMPHNEYSFVAAESTCSLEGIRTVMCNSCGQQLRTESIPKAAHTPGSWVTVQEAQVGVAGIKVMNCQVCGVELQREEIPALPQPAFTPYYDYDAAARVANNINAIRASMGLSQCVYVGSAGQENATLAYANDPYSGCPTGCGVIEIVPDNAARDWANSPPHAACLYTATNPYGWEMNRVWVCVYWMRADCCAVCADVWHED